jgi:beta-carotene hydroxylase
MDQVIESTSLAALSDEELDVLERQIAGKYMGKVPWGAVIWGIGNCLIFIALFPLVLSGLVPLWAGFIVATLNVILAYLPSHEAQHNIIAGRGKPLRWLNELVGHMSVIPMVYPYRILRATHMEHHKHTNDPEKDCDIDLHARSQADFFRKALINRQPASTRNGAYGNSLERTGQSHLMLDALLLNAAYLIFMFSMAWSGYALEMALLWWIPKMIGETYISYYLAWAPHYPGNEQGRYRDTRAFKSRFGNLVSMGMQFHIIHHLYPRIPLSLTPAAYRELRPILEQRGCELGGL